MKIQNGRKSIITGAVLLLVKPIVSIISIIIYESFIIDVLYLPLQFLAIIGYLVILDGVRYITEEINKRYIYTILLLGFIGYIFVGLVYVGMSFDSGTFTLARSIILYYLPLFIFQGILISVSFFRIGVAFNSMILKISGIFFFISTVFSLVVNYLSGTLQSFPVLVSIISQSLTAITYTLVLLGFIFLKTPALTEQEAQEGK